MPKRGVQRWLYELYAYYAIFIGVTSYRYDFVLRQYRSTKWTQLVASVANLCILSLLLVDLYCAWFTRIKVDKVTGDTIKLDTTVNNVACLLRLVQRVPRERATCEIAAGLRRLRHLYQHRWTDAGQAGREQRLQHIYLAKNCLLWLQVGFLTGFMIIVFKYLAVPQNGSFVDKLLVLLFIMAKDSQDVEMHTHFLLSWRICRMYMRLNNRIKNLVLANYVGHALELHHLRWQHAQLAALMRRLTVVYKFSIISFRLSLVVTAAALGYYFSVFRSQPTVYPVFSFGLYTVLALDGYVLDLICDWTVSCHRETSWLLRQQDELKQTERQLSRGCELFTLQIACFPLQVEPYGLFAIGKAAWLSNIACILSWMFVLLQYGIVMTIKG